MQVVGITTSRDVYVGSRDRNFRMNEYLTVEDPVQGGIQGEVVEAQTFNRFIPLDIGGDFAGREVIESLKALGYDVGSETVYLGKIRFFHETMYPALTGSPVRVPSFSELKSHLIHSTLEDGLVIGAIRNTDELYREAGTELKDILHTFERGEWKAQGDIPFLLDLRSMHQYPHIGVFGGSGSGKSFGLRVVLEELMKKRIPTVVLDPHYEMDFSEPSPIGMDREFEGRFSLLTIGEDIGVRFEEMTSGDLKNLLGARAELTESMANVVDTLFKKGNNQYTFSHRIEDLLAVQELRGRQEILEHLENSSGEEREIWKRRLDVYDRFEKNCPNPSVKGINWRFRQLEFDGIFQGDISPVEEGLKLGKLVVIRGSTAMISVFSTYLLNHLYRLRRNYRDSTFRGEADTYFPPFTIVTDEAHNFAPKGFPTPARRVIREISQEGRKYGVNLILATQRPTLLDETVTAQLNTKLIFRTVRAGDMDTIREETDISAEDVKRLPYLRTGDVFISSSSIGRTLFVRIRGALTESPHSENPLDELRGVNKKGRSLLYQGIKDYLPINQASDPVRVITELERNHSLFYTATELEAELDALVDSGFLRVESNILGKVYFDRMEDQG